MEEYMQKALTDEIIEEAAKRYGFILDNLQFVGGFENFVYEYQKDDTPYILRFVHSGHRSYELVLAEIEFIDYLAHNNAPVSTVIHSINDKITERIPINDQEYFSITSFTKAKGTYVKQEEKTPELFTLLGKDIGRLHRLTKDFAPKHKRLHWYEENYYDIALRALPKEDAFIIDILRDIIATIKALPTNRDNYGLIHTDLHFGNMYYDQQQLTFFDFDDASYKHFISDIAIVLYYDSFRMELSKQQYNERARFILKHLMRGYETENTIDTSFLQHLNEFLYLRSVILYVVLVAAGMHISQNPDRRAFMELQRKRVIEHSMDLDLTYVLEGL